MIQSLIRFIDDVMRQSDVQVSGIFVWGLTHSARCLSDMG